MSFGKSRQKEIEYEFRANCHAHGCPMRGTVSSDGSRYFCAYHHNAEPEDWSKITTSIHQNDQIRLAIAQIVKTGESSWEMGEWKMMHRYFDNQTDLQPQGDEKNYKSWYESRLRNELAYRAGVGAKPKVRIKEQRTNSGPKFGAFSTQSSLGV